MSDAATPLGKDAAIPQPRVRPASRAIDPQTLDWDWLPPDLRPALKPTTTAAAAAAAPHTRAHSFTVTVLYGGYPRHVHATESGQHPMARSPGAFTIDIDPDVVRINNRYSLQTN